MSMNKRIHLIAACGTGMGTLACILKEMGHEVTGSDQNVYPPMSDFLEQKGITLFQGYDPVHLDHQPDLVIIGNAISRGNPEAEAALENGFEYMSMPQAVNRFVARDKKIILVTGTHGKTTTSSIMAHILHTAGMDPSFMIGGIVKDFNSSFRIGKGDYMVIEGDEYDTAFFDKGPKFMHYDPDITIMTGIEFDHADIFTDIDHINRVFYQLVDKIKDSSHIIAYGANDNLDTVLSQVGAAAEKYGEKGDWICSGLSYNDHRTRFEVHGPDSLNYEVETGLPGRHNMFNALACMAVAHRIGIASEDVCRSLGTFSGVKRRQEIRGVKGGITIMDDFAHHPTAVKETIAALKPSCADGRLIAVFEPRTNTSMRSFFQNIYPAAFADADMVCVCDPQVKKNIPPEQRFSTRKLVADIAATGVEAYQYQTADEVVASLVPMLKPKDLVLVMSNGGFDNIHVKLLEKIQ